LCGIDAFFEHLNGQFERGIDVQIRGNSIMAEVYDCISVNVRMIAETVDAPIFVGLDDILGRKFNGCADAVMSFRPFCA
jgi:hypothetical protein